MFCYIFEKSSNPALARQDYGAPTAQGHNKKQALPLFSQHHEKNGNQNINN